MSQRSRFLPFCFAFLLAFLVVVPGRQAAAQSLKGFDAGVSVFGNIPGNTSGNGVNVEPTYSVGTVVTARQSLHFWLGWEVNYGYTRFAERYKSAPYGTQVQTNMHEVTGAYLVQGPTIPILGLQPFGAVGVGALVFLPTTTGGQYYSQQYRVPILYEFGVNYPLFTSHLGLRLQYRGLSYKTPDFGAAPLTTGSRQQTSEPSAGAYFRF